MVPHLRIWPHLYNICQHNYAQHCLKTHGLYSGMIAKLQDASGVDSWKSGRFLHNSRRWPVSGSPEDSLRPFAESSSHPDQSPRPNSTEEITHYHSSGGSFGLVPSFIRRKVAPNAQLFIEKSSLQRTKHSLRVLNTLRTRRRLHCVISYTLIAPFEVRQNGANMYRQMLTVGLKR